METEEGPQREISYSARWSDNTCVDHLQRGGGRKKRFQLSTNYTGLVILYFRAIQGHSGKTTVVPSLLDNVLIPEDFFEFIYHTGSGLIPKGKVHG